MLAHIRYATSGQVELSNLHPFSREMWGIQWCFCHNGQIALFDDQPESWIGPTCSTDSDDESDDEDRPERVYFPVGDTDSEAFFCAVLNSLRAQFTDSMPTLPVLFDALKNLCDEVVQYNPAGTILNFMLTCGPNVLWVYSWPGARPGSKVWNGLHYTIRGSSTKLGDADYSVGVSMPGSKEDQVAIVATAPLTDDEEWIELKPGELILMDDGLPRVSIRDLFRVEILGHGLNNNGRTLAPPRLEEDMRRYEFKPDYYAAGGI